MKISNFFLIVSLLGILPQPPQPSLNSIRTSSLSPAATQEVRRTYTNVKSINTPAFHCNDLWAGTDGGMVRWNTMNDSYATLTGNNACEIASDSAGKAWFGMDSGLSQFDGASWITYTTNDGLASNYVNVIAGDSAGKVWFGTDSGLSQFDGASWTTYTTADGLADDHITGIARDPLGNLWIVGDGGVSKFDGSTWIAYTTANGLPSELVRDIASDASGNVWVGIYTCGSYWCDGAGVSKFDGSHWTIYTRADGLADDYVTAIASDPAGNMWFGTRGYGVSKFDGSHWITYITADGLAGNSVWAIASDPAGNLWFGTDGAGVSKFDGASWTTFTSADGLASNHVSAIASDADGNLWFGTDVGVSELYFIRSLSANYAGGAPGSFFNLDSDHFPANQSVPVSVNGTQLGDIPISANGVFTFTLSTNNADQGFYIIKVGEHPSVQVRLTLDAQQPIRPKEGDFTTFDIPSGIAFTKEYYLPLLQK